MHECLPKDFEPAKQEMYYVRDSVTLVRASDPATFDRDNPLQLDVGLETGKGR